MGGKLSDKEVEMYLEKGYLGPYRLFDPDVAHDLLQRIESDIDEADGHPSGHDQVPDAHDRHLDSPAMYEVCSHPGIVERTADLYGEDVLLWSSRLWKKEGGAPEYPWHQGDHFHPIEPPVTMTAWVALTEATEENGCLKVVPGSHSEVVPHVEAGDDKGFNEMADPDRVDEEAAVSLELEPGEFVMFNERCLHGSLPNDTDEPRIGVSARLIPPLVKVQKGWGTMVVNGEDSVGLNETAEPPVEY